MSLTCTTSSRFAKQADFTISEANLTTTESFRVSDIGTLEVSHDIDRIEIDSEDSVLFDLGKLTVTVFDTMNGGSRFYDVINDEVVNATDRIKLQLSITPRDRSDATVRTTAFTDVFYFTKQDIKQSRNGLYTTIECYADYDEDIDELLEDFIDNNFDPSDIVAVRSVTEDGVLSGDFINKVLELINPDASSSEIINTSEYFDEVLSGLPNGTQVPIVLKTLQQTAKNIFFQLAAVEGAYVGTAMGYSYFARRNLFPTSATGRNVITSNDILQDSYRLEAGFNLYAYISAIFIGLKTPFNFINFSGGSFYSTVGVSADATEGENVLSIDDRSGGSATADTIPVNSAITFVNDGVDFNNLAPQFANNVYFVAKQTSTTLTLNTPLQEDVNNNATIFPIQDYNEFGTKGLSLGYLTRSLLEAVYDSSVPDFNPSAAVGTDFLANTNDKYSIAYGANNQKKVFITVDGIEKIAPFSNLILSDGFPEEVQGSYYISKMKISYAKDTIEMELKEIL